MRQREGRFRLGMIRIRCIHTHTKLLKNKLKDFMRKPTSDWVRHFEWIKFFTFFSFIHFWGTQHMQTSENNLKVILSIYHVGPKHGTQVLRLGGKHPHPQSHLKSPGFIKRNHPKTSSFIPLHKESIYLKLSINITLIVYKLDIQTCQKKTGEYFIALRYEYICYRGSKEA